MNERRLCIKPSHRQQAPRVGNAMSQKIRKQIRKQIVLCRGKIQGLCDFLLNVKVIDSTGRTRKEAEMNVEVAKFVDDSVSYI